MQQLKLINDIVDKSYASIQKLDISKIKKCKTDKTRPFLRYPGSKYNASKYIMPFWDSIEFNEYREPFLGSGAIFFKMPKVEYSWLNDIDDDLINCFSIIANEKTRLDLIKKIENLKPSKELFDDIKNTKPINSIDKAYRYFLINRMAYGGIMNKPNWGFHPTKSVQPDKWGDRIMQAGIKLEDNVKITKKSYLDVINAESNNKVWLFVDPPYFKADQKRAYAHSFNYKDHIELLNSLKKTKHYFCLTYDNCEEIKELYSWANIYEIEWMYHTANSKVASRKMGKELIISNYKIHQV